MPLTYSKILLKHTWWGRGRAMHWTVFNRMSTYVCRISCSNNYMYIYKCRKGTSCRISACASFLTAVVCHFCLPSSLPFVNNGGFKPGQAAASLFPLTQSLHCLTTSIAHSPHSLWRSCWHCFCHPCAPWNLCGWSTLLHLTFPFRHRRLNLCLLLGLRGRNYCAEFSVHCYSLPEM